MILADLFIKTSKLIKNNLVLFQPLLIFILLADILIATLIGINEVNLAAVIFIILAIEFFCAFMAGWFNMFHKSIELYAKPVKDETEKAMNSITLFKEFMPGVGKYFIRITIALIIYVLGLFVILNILNQIGASSIGMPESLNLKDLLVSVKNETDLMTIINNISEADKIKIVKWEMLILLSTGLFSYLTMFLMPAIVSANKSPLKAYFTSLQMVFKKPLTTFSIFLAFSISLFMVNVINALGATTNFVVQLIGLMLFVFVILYFTMMIFIYFEKYSENTCNSGTDSVG